MIKPNSSLWSWTMCFPQWLWQLNFKSLSHSLCVFLLFSRLLFLILWLYPSVQYLLFQCSSLLMVLTFYFTWNIAAFRLRGIRLFDIDWMSHGPALLFLRTFLQRSSYLLALRPCLLELANGVQVRHGVL